MAKSLHARYVDRRLSLARQQLVFAESENLTRIQREGAVDNALLQLGFAVSHYINELLESYQQPSLGLMDIINEPTFFAQYQHVSELMEIKQLAQSANSWLSLLIQYPAYMLQQAEGLPSDPVQQQGASSTIELVNITEESLKDLLNGQPLALSKAHWVVDQCSQLIQRQRENLIEC